MPDITFRAGITFPSWGGVILEGDPGAVPPNRFRDAVNVRINGTEIDCRGGQAKLDPSGTADDDGCISGIWPADHEPAGPFLHMRSANAFSQGPLFRFDVGDAVGLPTYDTDGVVNGGGLLPDRVQVLQQIEGTVYMGASAGRLLAIRGTTITLVLDLSLPDTTYITGIAKIGDVFYLAACDSLLIASAVIYAWDGETPAATTPVPVDDTVALPGAVALFATSQNELLAYWSEGEFFAAGTVNTIRRRAAGAAHPGTWTTLTYPGGITNGYFYDAEESGGKVYLAARGTAAGVVRAYVFVYDPTLPTIVSVANGPFGSAPARCKRVLNFNSLLTYAWVEDYGANDTHDMFLGTTANGTVWNDSVKDFTAQFFPDQRPLEPFGLAQFEGTLYLMANSYDSGSGQGSILLASPGTDLAGTWVGLEEDPALTGDYYGVDFQHGMVFEL